MKNKWQGKVKYTISIVSQSSESISGNELIQGEINGNSESKVELSFKSS